MDKHTQELIESNRKKDSVTELKTQLSMVTDELVKANELLKIYNTPLNPITEIKTPKDNKIKDYATVLTLLSDIHAEHKITLESTNGLNKYSLLICGKRIETYFLNLVRRIKKHQKEVIIDELVMGMLGDMIHGFIHEEYLRTNYLTPIEAMMFVIEQLERGLKYLINNVGLKRISIICKVGNHSRQTKKIYTDEEALHSYEWGIYSILRKLFPDLNWIMEVSYFSYFKVYDKQLRFSHGHRIKYQGGIGGISVPLQRNRLRVDQQRKADLNCIAHFHTTEFSRNTRTLLNGSVCGADAYSIGEGFESEPPMQQFLLIDSKRGFTVNEPILLT